ncbi:MAG: PAS domain S-box protein [Candidatus Kapabacteria bacterium]|nr:PAS domain S-box protein [Ignavibacteriota bacterium]MCW5884588.1 PAS domain S-box protein [Candidatus Kapabacteria bacterium]
MKRIYLISISAFVLAISVAVFSYFELNETKDYLFDMSRSESENMIYALKQSIENNIKTNEIIRDEIVNSLVAASSLADHLNTHKRFTKKQMQEFAEMYDLDFLFLLDRYGVVSNLDVKSLDDLDERLNEYLRYVSEEVYFWLDLGVHEVKGNLYYIVGGEFHDKKSLIVGGIDESKLLDLRKSIGIGKLINDFSDNPEIEYVALQDEIGLIAATHTILPLSTVDSDAEMQNLNETNSKFSRIVDYNEKKILESVIKIENEDDDLYLRLGLSLDKVRAINQSNTRRTIVLSLGLFLIAFGTSAFIYQRSRHIKLREEYKQMLDYTSILLSNINEGVIGIDKNQNIILYNHKSESLFGKIDLGKKIDFIFDIGFLNLSESILAGKSFGYNEIEHTRQNGDKLILAYSTSAIIDSNEEPYISIAVIRDITQIKQAEEIKQRNEKLKATATLAAGVAHEIRNPMNAINVIAQRLEFEFEPNQDKEHYFELVHTVRQEIKRIDKIISQFLEFSKISKMSIKKDDLNIPVINAVNLLQSSALEKSISINYKSENNIFANIDKDKIQQVFINLIQNALDASNENSEILIQIKDSVQDWIVTISDSGAGINDEIKDKIFDIYFTTKSKGTGLGLGIVNKIIEEHDGKIYFESNSTGTTFFVVLKKA